MARVDELLEFEGPLVGTELVYIQRPNEEPLDRHITFETLATAVRKLPSYAVAGAPDASEAGAGAMIYVTNGNAGAACVAVSNGSAWKVVALGATISAT